MSRQKRTRKDLHNPAFHNIRHDLRHSQQIPALIKSSLSRGQGGMVGAGANIWSNVHIDEVADLYIIVLDVFSDDPLSALEHGHAGYYFAENGEHKLYDVCKTIAEVLYECGRGESPTPTTYNDEEMPVKRYFTPNSLKMLGANSRSRSVDSQDVPVTMTAVQLIN